MRIIGFFVIRRQDDLAISIEVRKRRPTARFPKRQVEKPFSNKGLRPLLVRTTNK